MEALLSNEFGVLALDALLHVASVFLLGCIMIIACKLLSPCLPKTNLSSIPTDPSTFAIDGSRYVSSMLTHALENHGFSGPGAAFSPDLANNIHQSVLSAHPQREKRIFLPFKA